MIAPGAPPVEKSTVGVSVALDVILDTTDVDDTLVGLRAHAEGVAEGRLVRSEALDLPHDGSFAFGIAGVGRFRVSFVTQRGSRVLSVSRVPFVVPGWAKLCREPKTIEALLHALRAKDGGIVALFGPDPTQVATLAYALLAEINGNNRKIITTLERQLSFLMRHDSSIVIQRELGVDVMHLQQGIVDAIAMGTDILYLGDLLHTDCLPEIGRLVEMHGTVLLNVTASDADAFVNTMRVIMGERFDLLGLRTREVAKVLPTGEGLFLDIQRLEGVGLLSGQRQLAGLPGDG